MLRVDIKKTFPGFCLGVAFETTSLVTGILGASGCGKSLTLKCIAGTLSPDEGIIELDGRTLFDSSRGINLTPQLRKVGYLFQNYALFPTMTAKENIQCAIPRSYDSGKRTQTYNSLIQMLNLGGIENQRPHTLSGGQAQRVAIARMLAAAPSFILLDEPFSALDTFLKRSVISELSTIIKTIGTQAIIVSHSQKELRTMAEELLVMNKGSIIQSGPTEQVFNSPTSEEAKILLEDF